MKTHIKHIALFMAFIMLNNCSDEKMAEKLESKMQGVWKSEAPGEVAILTIRSNEWHLRIANPGGCVEINGMINYVNSKEIGLYDCFEIVLPGCCETCSSDPEQIADSKRWLSFPSKSELCVKWSENDKCDEYNIFSKSN